MQSPSVAPLTSLGGMRTPTTWRPVWRPRNGCRTCKKTGYPQEVLNDTYRPNLPTTKRGALPQVIKRDFQANGAAANLSDFNNGTHLVLDADTGVVHSDAQGDDANATQHCFLRNSPMLGKVTTAGNRTVKMHESMNSDFMFTNKLMPAHKNWTIKVKTSERQHNLWQGSKVKPNP